MNTRDKITNPDDMRVRRTRKLLSGALLELMQKKPFSSISVVDICDEAMVHRTTFYSHFVDKHELLRYAAAEKQREFEEQELSGEGFEDVTDFYVDLFRKVLVFLRNNRGLFSSGNARSSSMDMQVARRILADSIYSYIQKYRAGARLSEVPPEVEAQCIAGAVMALAAWWLEADTPISEDDMCHYVSLLLRPETRA